MPKCPYCGSTSHVVDAHQQYFETSEEAIFLHFYKCTLCRKTFRGTSAYSRKNYKEEYPMKTANYLYIAHSQMYGMLHGIHTGGCLEAVTLEDAKETARSEAYDIVTGYDCIMEAIHEDINDQFGYDETPDNPDEEYLDAVEDAIQEECVFSLFEITPEGEVHWEEMEEDYECYEDFLEEGWIRNC